MTDLKLALGFENNNEPSGQNYDRTELLRYLNLKLAANGLPVSQAAGGTELVSLAAGLITNFREKTRLLYNHRCPVDQRIEDFLNRYFADVLSAEAQQNGQDSSDAPSKNQHVSERLRIPGRALVCDRYGLTRELSLPPDGDEFES